MEAIQIQIVALLNEYLEYARKNGITKLSQYSYGKRGEDATRYFYMGILTKNNEEYTITASPIKAQKKFHAFFEAEVGDSCRKPVAFISQKQGGEITLEFYVKMNGVRKDLLTETL